MAVLDTTHFDTVRFPPPPWALEAFSRASHDGSLAYTPYRGNLAVRRRVAETLTGFLGVQLDPETDVVLTPGTQAGLFASLAALAERGSRVLLVDPDYLFAGRILRFLGAEVTRIPLARTDSGPQPDLDALEAALRGGPALLVFSHPNNPTGAVYPATTIARIAALVEHSGSTVIIDELYARLTYDSPLAHLAACEGMRERCITLLGPSKTESLSGYRIGVVIGPGAMMDRVEEMVSITSLRAPGYAQQLLTHWLVDDHEWLATRIADFRRLRDLTVARLSELSWLRADPPMGTAYLFPDVSALNLPDDALATRLLDGAEVVVTPGRHFGPSGSGHFRVCYAREEQAWDETLGRMVNVLGALASR